MFNVEQKIRLYILYNTSTKPIMEKLAEQLGTAEGVFYNGMEILFYDEGDFYNRNSDMKMMYAENDGVKYAIDTPYTKFYRRIPNTIVTKLEDFYEER